MGRDPECLFCKIVAGRMEAAQVFKTEDVVAFLDINPVASGHTLIVPVNHAARLADSAAEDLAAVGRHVPRVVAAVLEVTGAPACNVVINDGSQAGQIIPHVHAHVIPRTEDDEVRHYWPHGSYTDQQRERMRAAIAEALGGS